MALNDTSVRNAKPTGGKRELLAADVGGLYLRVRVGTTGKIARTWQFRAARVDGLTITTLGTYPAMTLKEARLKAAELALKKTSTESPTVAEAVDQWCREVVDASRKDADKVRWFLDRASRTIGDLRVANVQPADIARVVRAYRDEAKKNKRASTEGRVSARRMLSLLKSLFTYCCAVGWISASPAATITGAALGAPNKARSRVLTLDEIKWVLRDTSPQASVWRFLVACGLRIGEAYSGHRKGDFWIVPAAASKNGKRHAVFLSPLALAQIEAQPWPPRWSVQISLSLQKKGFTCHDLRRTFSTRMNEDIKVAPHIVEKMLNHSLGGVLATYNVAEYMDERRQALEAWSAWLLALVDAKPAVVPLRTVA